MDTIELSVCRYCTGYKTFEALYTGKSERFVELFLDSDHSLTRCEAEINKYKAIIAAVSNRPMSIPLHLFLVDTRPVHAVRELITSDF